MKTACATAFTLVAALAVCLAHARLSAAPPPPFTHPPTDMESVGSIRPLGTANPGGDHVLPVDHMYINYQVPGTGTETARVYAMGGGTISMVIREHIDGHADYGVFIRHTEFVTSYFLHVHELSARLDTHIAGASWIAAGSLEVLLLGQLGAPAPFGVAAGEIVGLTRNYSHSWDVGVIDSRVTGDFVGGGERRYPTLTDYMRLLGIVAGPPYPGQDTLNAVCFLDYMPTELANLWRHKLTSGGTCGRVGWDLRARLRGSWFNPELDRAPVPPLFDIESAALSIVPDPNQPESRVQISFGTGGPYSLMPSRDQLRQAFFVTTDGTRGARINPDPANVRIRDTGVCYDLPYAGGTRFDMVQFFLIGSSRLQVRYTETAAATPQCGELTLIEPPGPEWLEYVR